MEVGFQVQNGGLSSKYSNLIELSASGDLSSFLREIESGSDLHEPILWYGRRIGSKQMGFEERTPLMIAAMFGNIEVLKFIVESGKIDVNRASRSDGATALHCASAGGSKSSFEIVKLLVGASADKNSLDVKGKKPIDLIAPALKSSCNFRRRSMEMLLRGGIYTDDHHLANPEVEEQKHLKVSKEGNDKYPIDASLPDINTGIYGCDEFRMYSFKVKPCSRAYSHDWTECPFVHPGENARRRDPRKYPYSCVPCLEFRKSSCQKGDSCEYAHGVFESWLHPAQYRTRLCKDETGCNRKVCFFAHKHEELRPLYLSTGSAIPSPRSQMDMGMNQISLSSSPMSLSTPPLSPSSPKSNISMWNKPNLSATPPGSRLRTSFNARDLDLELELLQQQQRSMDEIEIIAANNNTNLNDILNMDPSLLSQLQMSQNMNQIHASFPMRKNSSFGLSRPTSFLNRSHSFVDRGFNGGGGNSVGPKPSNLNDWRSPDGKLDWGIQGEELSKLKKTTSFAYRGGVPLEEEPDVSWVNSLMKDVTGNGLFGSDQQEQDHHLLHPGHGHGNGGVIEMIPPSVEQLYREQQQMVA